MKGFSVDLVFKEVILGQKLLHLQKILTCFALSSLSFSVDHEFIFSATQLWFGGNGTMIFVPLGILQWNDFVP